MAAARAVLTGTPAAAGPELEASAAAFGLALPAELAAPAAVQPFDVWRSCWPAVRLFMAMVTQVRVSQQGVVGFDYAVLPIVERRLGFSKRQARNAFADLPVMEQAMVAWHREG